MRRHRLSLAGKAVLIVASLFVAGAVESTFGPLPRLVAQGLPDGRRGPDRDDPERRPWLQVHFAEIDADHDRVLTWTEMEAEVAKTFAGYATGTGESIPLAGLAGPPRVRSALAGFVREHAAEIDTNGDRAITLGELRAIARRMFDQADRNRDGRIEPGEFSAGPPRRRQGG